jgi:hypothetical protein
VPVYYILVPTKEICPEKLARESIFLTGFKRDLKIHFGKPAETNTSNWLQEINQADAESKHTI